MKKYLILIVSFALLAYTGFAQLQATLKLKVGSPNTVVVAVKSTGTLSSTILSSFQVAIGIPASVSAGLSAAIVSKDPLMVFNPQALVSTEDQNAVSYTVYTFNGDGTQSGAGVTYAAGVETDYAEISFTGGSLTINDVRIMQLPNGGSNSQVNFYVADRGTDVVNQVAQFYSTLPTNVSNDGNGYGGSSWARMGPIVLPVKFIGFNAIKKDNNAFLTWQIENENSLTDRYEIERSLNGVDFRKAYTVLPKNNGNSTNSYELTDLNLSSIRSSGIFYYRIKQVDKDGRFINTGIKSVRLNSKGIVIGVYPNPIKNTAKVTIDLEQDANATVTINDASGKQMQTIQMQLFKGPNIKEINMGAFAAGSYMLKVQTASEIKTIPVVKTN
jgi:Secretion system C-terminal sorting domain